MSSDNRDWTKTGAVQGMAQWVVDKSDVICAVVIRRNDAVFIVDANCAPADARDLIEERLPELEAAMNQARQEKRESQRHAARIEMEAVSE